MDSEVREVRQLLASVASGQTVEALADDEPFFDRGAVDSMQLVEIIDRFQAELGVEVAGGDLSPENFGSIAAMAGFLARKRSSPPNSPAGG